MATPVGTGTKSRRIEPLTKRKAWKALQTHYEKVLIHQGTRLISCDFITFGQPLNQLGRHHDMLSFSRQPMEV